LLSSAWLENVVQPGLESFGASHEFDESLHVVRYGKGILCSIVSETIGLIRGWKLVLSILSPLGSYLSVSRQRQ
jgi:hypothetical protein